jgi:hypothetical protein
MLPASSALGTITGTGTCVFGALCAPDTAPATNSIANCNPHDIDRLFVIGSLFLRSGCA